MPARARRAGVRALRTLYSTSTGVNRFSGLQPFVIPCIEPGVFPFLSCKVPGRASRAVDDRLCCKVRAMISVPPVWFWIVSYEKYSIRVGISLCTVVKARQARVTGPRSWSPRGAHPVPREGVVIIAATRGQQHLGDNGLGHGPDPSGPRSPFGARCGHHGRVWSQGHRRPPVGSAPPRCLHADGSLWCSRQPLGYTRDTILGDLSQGLGLLLGEDLPRPIVRRGCVVKTMIFGCGTIQGVSLVISSAR